MPSKNHPKLGKIVTATNPKENSIQFPCTGEIIDTTQENKTIFVTLKPLGGGPLLKVPWHNCHKPKTPNRNMRPNEAWAAYLHSGGKFQGNKETARILFQEGFKAGKRKK